MLGSNNNNVLRRIAEQMLADQVVRQYVGVCPDRIWLGWPDEKSSAAINDLLSQAARSDMSPMQLMEAAFSEVSPSEDGGALLSGGAGVISFGPNGSVRVRVARARGATDFWVELVDTREVVSPLFIEDRLTLLEKQVASLRLGGPVRD